MSDATALGHLLVWSISISMMIFWGFGGLVLGIALILLWIKLSN